jgi:predicted N-acyltransferase
MAFLNQLEPDGLLRHFRAHPPTGFQALDGTQGTPLFVAPFDLLTTADDALRRRIANWPLYRFWSRLLRPRTCFVGTTVTEYAVFPASAEPAVLAQSLKAEFGRRHMLLIVKDIPQDSPLLDAHANAWSADFAKAAADAGFVLLEGQALAWVPIDFDSADAYLAGLSSSRRKNIRRKLRSRDGLDIEAVRTGSAFSDPARVDEFYALYSQVYAQSEIHFDRLERDFFRVVLQDEQSEGIVFVYRHQGEMIGWNLCYEREGRLVDKYIGLAYPQAREHNLYVISWMHNLEYARQRGLTHYVAGWTDPEVKVQLGAQLSFTRHAVYVRNPLLRAILRRFAGHFESDRLWQERHAASHHS